MSTFAKAGLLGLGAGAAMLIAAAASDGASYGQSTASVPAAATPALTGKALAFDRTAGNCLACHTMAGGDVPSNVGPELSNMKARFPDRNALYAVLWDEESRNPQTVMPAFGKNLILDKQQINDIIDFLYTL
jgi:sulfur-oxidizing protein SoxX